MSDAPPARTTPPEPLRAGRDALIRHAWVEASEQLSKADREGQLNGADLDPFALVSFFGGAVVSAVSGDGVWTSLILAGVAVVWLGLMLGVRELVKRREAASGAD